MYALIRSLLFCFEPERAHELALSILKHLPFHMKINQQPVQAMGIEFPNGLGLAAGFDKNAQYLNALAKLGFGFIEAGTVTPKAQLGNPKPRVFRLPQQHALINRMGFSNVGVDGFVAHIERAHYTGVLGINIGKNKDTPLNLAINDYVYCLRKTYPYASYITVNISSPNTPDLRQLQHKDYFSALMDHLREEQLHLCDAHQRYVPLVVKLSPDETDESLKHMADVMLGLGIDGIIATNTTRSREGVESLPNAHEDGGLSGQPLMDRSTWALRVIKEIVGNDMTLIGVGGIHDVNSAAQKIQAGASLLQLYTGLIYQGPRLIKDIIEHISG